MKRFLVRSGDLEEEVELDVPGVDGHAMTIAAAAVRQCAERAEADLEGPPPPDMNEYMSVVELSGVELWLKSSDAIHAAGRDADRRPA